MAAFPPPVSTPMEVDYNTTAGSMPDLSYDQEQLIDRIMRESATEGGTGALEPDDMDSGEHTNSGFLGVNDYTPFGGANVVTVQTQYERELQKQRDARGAGGSTTFAGRVVLAPEQQPETLARADAHRKERAQRVPLPSWMPALPRELQENSGHSAPRSHHRATTTTTQQQQQGRVIPPVMTGEGVVNIAFFQTNQHHFLLMSGFSEETFTKLATRLRPSIQKPRECDNGAPPSPEINVSYSVRFFLFLVTMRGSVVTNDLRRHYNLNEYMVAKDFTHILKCCFKLLRDEVAWPSAHARVDLANRLPELPGCIGGVVTHQAPLRTTAVDAPTMLSLVVVDFDGRATFARTCINKSAEEAFQTSELSKMRSTFINPGQYFIAMEKLHPELVRAPELSIRPTGDPAVEAQRSKEAHEISHRHATARSYMQWLTNTFRILRDPFRGNPDDFPLVFLTCVCLGNALIRADGRTMIGREHGNGTATTANTGQPEIKTEPDTGDQGGASITAGAGAGSGSASGSERERATPPFVVTARVAEPSAAASFQQSPQAGAARELTSAMEGVTYGTGPLLGSASSGGPPAKKPRFE